MAAQGPRAFRATHAGVFCPAGKDKEMIFTSRICIACRDHWSHSIMVWFEPGNVLSFHRSLNRQLGCICRCIGTLLHFWHKHGNLCVITNYNLPVCFRDFDCGTRYVSSRAPNLLLDGTVYRQEGPLITNNGGDILMTIGRDWVKSHTYRIDK